MPSSAHEAANGDASELPKYADEIVARLREEQVGFLGLMEFIFESSSELFTSFFGIFGRSILSLLILIKQS
jgi:hypothetical protein